MCEYSSNDKEPQIAETWKRLYFSDFVKSPLKWSNVEKKLDVAGTLWFLLVIDLINRLTAKRWSTCVPLNNLAKNSTNGMLPSWGDNLVFIKRIHPTDSTKWSLSKVIWISRVRRSHCHPVVWVLESLFFICISFASRSLPQFPRPLQGTTDPPGSLNFWFPLCGVINGGGPGTCWGHCVEHPVCHQQIHPCASTGSLFSSAVIIYSPQSTLNHLLFILFALSIISLDLLSQSTGE